MKRDIAIDYLRSSVTVAVVAHHAALAYTTFSHYNPSDYPRSTAPVVDTVRFVPLDYLVSWNDLFFMSLMFLISGLFVMPSIARKGVGRFLADRAKRLGIPFIVAVTLLSPVAYYPSWLLSDSVSQADFLIRFFTTDGWSPGPAWFLWLLFAFCIAVAIMCQCMPNLMKKMSWSARSGGRLVLVFLAVSLLGLVPLNLLRVPEWLDLGGPLHLPASRSLLYFAWFLLGVAMGGANVEHSLSRENLKRWPLWLTIGGFSWAAYGAMLGDKYLANMPVWVMNLVVAIASSACCTFTSLAALGLARLFFRTSWFPADHFSENAYGVYIFHYGFVTVLQFSLLAYPMPAVVKFLITLSVALTTSWFLTSLLRKTAAKSIL